MFTKKSKIHSLCSHERLCPKSRRSLLIKNIEKSKSKKVEQIKSDLLFKAEIQDLSDTYVRKSANALLVAKKKLFQSKLFSREQVTRLQDSLSVLYGSVQLKNSLKFLGRESFAPQKHTALFQVFMEMIEEIFRPSPSATTDENQQLVKYLTFVLGPLSVLNIHFMCDWYKKHKTSVKQIVTSLGSNVASFEILNNIGDCHDLTGTHDEDLDEPQKDESMNDNQKEEAPSCFWITELTDDETSAENEALVSAAVAAISVSNHEDDSITPSVAAAVFEENVKSDEKKKITDSSEEVDNDAQRIRQALNELWLERLNQTNDNRTTSGRDSILIYSSDEEKELDNCQQASSLSEEFSSVERAFSKTPYNPEKETNRNLSRSATKENLAFEITSDEAEAQPQANVTLNESQSDSSSCNISSENQRVEHDSSSRKVTGESSNRYENSISLEVPEVPIESHPTTEGSEEEEAEILSSINDKKVKDIENNSKIQLVLKKILQDIELEDDQPQAQEKISTMSSTITVKSEEEKELKRSTVYKVENKTEKHHRDPCTVTTTNIIEMIKFPDRLSSNFCQELEANLKQAYDPSMMDDVNNLKNILDPNSAELEMSAQCHMSQVSHITEPPKERSLALQVFLSPGDPSKEWNKQDLITGWVRFLSASREATNSVTSMFSRDWTEPHYQYMNILQNHQIPNLDFMQKFFDGVFGTLLQDLIIRGERTEERAMLLAKQWVVSSLLNNNNTCDCSDH